MSDEPGFILLFAVATGVAIAAQRWRIPYTVALVVAGLGLGAVHAFQPPLLTKTLLFTVILPGLLFEAAFHLDAGELWRERTAVLALAVPGVLATITLTAALLTPAIHLLGLLPGFDWRHATVFGAIIAATDPIAVVAMVQAVGAPRRLGVLVEGESLLNDGTSIVLFGIVLGVVAGGAAGSAGAIVAEFVRVVGAGLAVGAAVGVVVSQVIRRVDDPMVEITLTTIAAYGGFALAERLHGSGVIATVVAGMLCGNYGARTGMSASTRVAAETFWSYVAFALNSIVFLLIGFVVDLRALAAAWAPILTAWLVMTAARAIVVGGVGGLLRLGRRPLPRGWATVLTWGGLRGALSMVLALSLPHDFPHRDFVVPLAFGVVVLSILGQGLTMAPLLRRLGIGTSEEAWAAFEAERAALQAADAALAELDAMERERLAPHDVVDVVRGEYRRRVADAEARLHALGADGAAVRAEQLQRTRRQVLLVEKDRILAALRHGALSGDAASRLLADVDGRLLAVERGCAAADGADAPGG